jgi:hypothetical protein
MSTSAGTVEDLASPGIVFQMGVVPRRIDILTRIEGVTFGGADGTRP